VLYPHVGIDSYFVVRQSQLGKANMLFGCQTVPIGCDMYVIRSVSLFIEHGGSRGGPTAS